MKKSIQFMFYVISVVIGILLMLGHVVKSEGRYLNWSEKDLFKTGRTLSIGATLTNPLKKIPSYQMSSQLPESTQDFGIDTSKISALFLQTNVLGEIGWTGGGIAAETASLGLGTLISTGRGAVSMWNAWRVGTGHAEQ